MNVVVSLEYRFHRTPDGKVWTQTAFPYAFWQRYMEVFDQVKVVARVQDIDSVPENWQQANGEGVSFAAIPYYVGPYQYLLKARQVKQIARNAVNQTDAVIFRLSSQIASCIQPILRKTGHPYGVEVVSDPYDAFAPGSVKHPLRPFFRWLFPQQLRRQCLDACASAYVTQYALQQRYPCPNFSVGISDVELSNNMLVAKPRLYDLSQRSFTLLLVGSLAQLYKAPDVLIEAVEKCVKDGLDLKLTLIGDGKYRAALEALTRDKGLETRIRFLGQLTAGAAVQTQLDQADLFVLPSKTEGLPRALIEAMARGLPCIGTSVGGIPELLPSEDLVLPGDVAALANKIYEVVTNPERMTRMSIQNLEKAQEYRNELLREQRISFYKYVREQTEAWLDNQKVQEND